MSKLTEVVQHYAIMISDHGNVAISKGLHYFGVTSLIGGASTSMAQKTGLIQTDPSWSLSDWGIAISIVGGVTLIVKNVADIWFSYRKHKRDEER